MIFNHVNSIPVNFWTKKSLAHQKKKSFDNQLAKSQKLALVICASLLEYGFIFMKISRGRESLFTLGAEPVGPSQARD